MATMGSLAEPNREINTTTHNALTTIIRKQRPVLPGETLPPAPPTYKKPAPQLPPLK